MKSLNGPENSVKNAKNMPCSWRHKNDVISMTHKLKSETSSQKIDVSADIIPGSLTLLTGFVIFDLNRWWDGGGPSLNADLVAMWFYRGPDQYC